MQRIKIIVYGKVQGVFYRKNTKEIAQELKLNGYVKNLPDGSVLVEAEGDVESLEKLRDWCAKGPTAARVDDIEVSWLEPVGYSGFQVKL